MFQNRSKLDRVLAHFQEYGISCGTMSYHTTQRGCILSALAVAHRKTTWPDLHRSGPGHRTVIYRAKGSHRKDVRRIANVIRERHPIQFGQYDDIKCCWKFNDYFAMRDRLEIIRVFEIAIARQKGIDIRAGQIGDPQRKIILIPEEAPDIPAPTPTPAPVKVPEKEPVPA